MASHCTAVLVGWVWHVLTPENTVESLLIEGVHPHSPAEHTLVEGSHELEHDDVADA